MGATQTIIMIAAMAVLLALLVWAIVVFNRLVRQRNMVRANWGQIDVQLVRRHDLIPNLVQTVQGYASHERATFDAVTRARTAAVAAQGPENQSDAESLLNTALGRLFAVAEAYPNLKASSNFLSLQDELANTENRIAYARQFYNDSVLGYNNIVQSFPSMVVARALSFSAAQYFAAEIGAAATPAVHF